MVVGPPLALGVETGAADCVGAGDGAGECGNADGVGTGVAVVGSGRDPPPPLGAETGATD